MNHLYIFSDVSMNPELGIGFGAYLAIYENHIHPHSHEDNPYKLFLKKFHSDSSTRLELQTLLWGLEDIQIRNLLRIDKLTVCTDSQCIAGLPERRKKLEPNDFIGKRSGRRLRNADLYQCFYQLHDLLRFDIVKIKGHCRADKKDALHRLFSHVDRESRQALKQHISSN